jgi:hypothetical protein
VKSDFVAYFHCALCQAAFDVPGGGRCQACGRIVCRSHLKVRVRPEGYFCDPCAPAEAATIPLGWWDRWVRVLRQRWR